MLALAALAGLGLFYGGLNSWLPSWPVLSYIVLGAALADGGLVLRPLRMRVTREVPGTLPLRVPCQIRLRLEYPGPGPKTIRLWDHFPAAFCSDALPISLTVASGRPLEVTYTATPERRGEHDFGPVEIRLRSPLGLWWRRLKFTVGTSVRVYPNFSPVIKHLRLSPDARTNMFGVRRLRRRGEGSEFHELRDYRSGDAMRQIDWRATARSRRLISRAYQDERDQRVIFMLDCGRRMRSTDGGISHFDESLNAILLLAYMALRQGDSVAMMTFGTGPETSGRSLAPIKGPGRVNEILNMLYDLEPSTEMPDYTRAATELLSRHRKHALVVLVTNLRGEDARDLIPALRTIRGRHLVLLASLRESALDTALDADVVDLEAALRVAGAHQLRAERRTVLRNLRTEGIVGLDVTPRELSAELVNAYMSLKASRAL